MIKRYGLNFCDRMEEMKDGDMVDYEDHAEEVETLKEALIKIANGSYAGASHIAMVALGLVKS